MDSRQETSELWKKTLSENQRILKRIFAPSIGGTESKEIEFRSTFPNRNAALEARSALKRIFPNDKEFHVLIMNVDAERVVYDCILSKVMAVDPSLITEIELGMSSVCSEYGGGIVSWGFLSNDPVRYQ